MYLKMGAVFFLYALLAMTAHAQSASFFDLPVLQPNVQPGSNYMPNDIDGDGVSDILWFNPTTSQFGYWSITVDLNGDFHRSGLRTIQVTAGYMIGALGDFNGDNRVDIVWTSANDDLYLWSSASGGGFESTMIGSYPAGWKLLGAADIDGDGHPDLLWQNDTTHQFAYWLMNGSKRVGSRIIDITPGYRIVAVGYFGQSRRASLVWQGLAGDLYDWDGKSGGFHSYYIGSLARSNGTYHLDSAYITNRDQTSYLDLITLDSTEENEEGYTWVRNMDGQGNALSSRFYNGSFGGWFNNSHRSGALYYRPFGPYTSHPMSIMTGRGDYMPYPQTVEVSNINNELPVFSSSGFFKSFPVDWYVVGAPWYRSDQVYYGPTARIGDGGN